MSWTIPAAGDIIRAQHVYQIINALNGTVGSAQAIFLTKLSTSDYSLDIKNLSTTTLTGGRALRALDPNGNTYVRMASFGTQSSPTDVYGSYFQQPVVFGTTDAHNSANQMTMRVQHIASPTAGISFVPVLVEYNTAAIPTGGFGSGTGQSDSGALTAIVRIMNSASGASQNGNANARALEPHAFVYANTGTQTAVEAMEVGIHTAVTKVAFAENPGAYTSYFGDGGILIHSDDGGIPTGFGSVVRANYGICLWGAAGFKTPILIYDTDQATKLFQINQSGQAVIRNRILAGGDSSGSAANPIYTTEGDPDTGDYPVGANQWGTSTGGTLRTTVSSSGLSIVNGLSYAQNLVETGFITPTQITSNTNDYSPTGLSTARVLRLSTDASRNLTGIAAQPNGTVLRIMNVGGFNLVLKNATTSAAANQFFINADVTVGTNQSYSIIYDTNVWRPA